ncbi:DEAD/DEAH box helicase [Empedobacter tilapiae]
MNFKNVYTETEERLKDSILSLWATGDATLQKYLLEILNEEKLMSTPAFQNTFPWTISHNKFGELTSLFTSEFINKLDKIKGEYEFPKIRYPYIHQVKSWETLLNTDKSIAVTTGTGSGKTECFMIPVLQDLHKNCANEIGVNAIFLYPLNALIGSQKKRIDSWVNALGGLRYAVYNGNTKETLNSAERNKLFPEISDRASIRENPPQILFTNPSMLEYILVRNKDVPLLEKSQGKLRWILLDEAHTLTGSNATEMALLIRRVIDAFGVKSEDVRFAITSATVGKGEESEANLKKFMSNLCGIDESKISIITGNRSFEELPKDFKIDNKEKLAVNRKLIYKNEALLLDDVVNGLIAKNSTIEEKLNKIDEISDIKLAEKSILPVRAHYYTRGIGGLYVCSNPSCAKHEHFEFKSPLGTMTTFAEKNCNSCHYPMYEVVACRSCGNELFQGDLEINNKGSQFIRFSTEIIQDAFKVDELDVVEENSENILPSSSSKIFFTKKLNNRFYTRNTFEFGLNKEGEINRNENVFIQGVLDHQCICPHCSGKLENPLHFRISSSFINRVLSDILLDNTPEASEIKQEMLWNGHKYISFSDSRQGTAKIAALINIDNESRWLQSQVYHKLIEVNQNNSQVSHGDKNEVIEAIRVLEFELANTVNPVLKRMHEDNLKILQNTQSNNTINIAITWKQMFDFLNSRNDLKTLFKNNNSLETNFNNIEKYTKALLFDNFSRRLPRERSLENLGLISIVMSGLENVILPNIVDNYKITLDEWKSLIKIGVDYIIRNGFFFDVPQNVHPYSTSFLKSFYIYNQDTQIVNAKTWPVYKRTEKRPNRLSLLLCAGLGYNSKEDIDNGIEDDINKILTELWKTIRAKLLTADGDGYKLNFEEKFQFQLAEKVWLCPVKRRLIDAHFRGYSPWISGELSEDNVKFYKIKDETGFVFPKFTNAFNLNEEKLLDIEATKLWIDENSIDWRDKGIWNNIHNNTLLNRPIYLAGEHSAQLSETRLKDLENKFEEAKINILNCSTTMEMGVDIGGISTVVMNNVPPGPANYLQRAGRAGRRNENKSLAFTICAPNPIGLNALSNPLWALEHKIAPPYVAFKSKQIIERHLNAFFFGKFVRQEVFGINVRGNLIDFFFEGLDPIASRFNHWLTTEDLLRYQFQIESITKGTIMSSFTLSMIISLVIKNFQTILVQTKNKKEGFEEKLKNMSEVFGENSPAFKAINFQLNQFLNQNAISYLAQNGFLPTAGLPTGIIEFEVNGMNEINHPNNKKENPSYFITRALTEYAPGNQIVIDGINYRSAGIIMQNDRGNETQRDIIQFCKSCGNQRIVEISEGQNIDTSCNHCGSNTFRGVLFNDPEVRGAFTEVIQPAGFAVDLYSSPNRKIEESSKIQYVDPILTNAKPWNTDLHSLYEIRESDKNAEILFYNIGNGNGFHICLHCGKTDINRDRLDNHRRLRGGKSENNDVACTGNNTPHAIKENVILGGRFKTDYVEIRIRKDGVFSNEESLLYTLGAVFTKQLAAYLAIENSELGFGIKQYEGFKTIFIFDTTKGGAGYSVQFYIHAEEIFKAAKSKLECTCESGCTKCIIDRDTQWHLNNLDRILALEWLQSNLDREIPTEVSNLFPNARFVLGGVKQDLNRLIYTNSVSEINLFVSSNIQEWNLDNIHFIKDLNKSIKINLIFTSQPIISDNNDLITLIQIKTIANLFTLNNQKNKRLHQICSVKKIDHSIFSYYSVENPKLDLNINWGDVAEGFIYSTLSEELDVSECILPIAKSGSTIYEIYLKETSTINSLNLSDLIVNQIQDKNDFINLLQNQTFNITYSDNYLKTYFGVILMLQFIYRLKEIGNFEIKNFTFKGKEFLNDRKPKKIFHEFLNSKSRNEYLRILASELDVIDTISAQDDNNPHFRFFELSNDKINIIIRPDAGVEHGWNVDKFSETDADYHYSLDEGISIFKRTNQPILYTISITKY